MKRQEAAPRASAPDVRLPGGPGRRESTRGSQAAAEMEQIDAVREDTLDSRGGRPGRVDIGPERSRRLLCSKTPGGTRRRGGPYHVA